MRHLATTLAAAAVLGLPTAAGAAPVNQRPVQYVSIQAIAGDQSSQGVADLAVTRDHGGFRLQGYVRADRGCVDLRAVNMHFGTYFGHDSIRRTCHDGQQIAVDAWTQHTDVVLTAIVPGGSDWDSKIVTLTGRP